MSADDFIYYAIVALFALGCGAMCWSLVKDYTWQDWKDAFKENSSK